MINRCHDCHDLLLAEAELDQYRQLRGTMTHRTWTVLDIGCGPNARLKSCLDEFDSYTGIDIHLEPEDLPDGCHSVDGAAMDFADDLFDEVVLIRALCQNDERTRRAMLREAKRVVRPGGFVHFCGPVQEARDRLQSLRIDSGLPPLPEPKSGGLLATDQDFRLALGPADLDWPVAPEYVLWTRLLCELWTGAPPEPNSPKARMYPRLREEAMDQDKAAFYRWRRWTV
jgi:SAM-dependent methyltransferase